MSESTPQNIENGDNDNIVVKMAQIRNSVDNWTIYIGVLLLGLSIAIISGAWFQISYIITSSFESFDIGPVIDVVNGLLNILFIPLFAALSDVYGRGIILTISLVISSIGLLVAGTAPSFGSYSAGNIIWALGETGRTLLFPIILADFLAPRNRGFGFILYWLPACIALGASLPVIAAAADDEKWRWLFNSQAILTVITGAPVLFGLFRLQLRAKRLLPQFNYKASSLLKVDWIGILSLSAGMGCILIPFTLVVRAENGWSSPSMFVPLIFGSIILVGFAIWELKYTKNPLVSYSLVRNRAAMTMILVRAFLMFDSNLTWQYMTPYLVLSRDITPDHAATIFLGFRLSWYIAGFICAFVLKRFNYARGMVWVALAINAIGISLTLPSRHPDSPEAFVVFAEAVIGFGAGSAACVGLVVLQTTVNFTEIANVTAIDSLLTSVFSSVAGAVGANIWNSSLRRNLINHLPAEFHTQIPMILADTEEFGKLPLSIKDNWLQALSDSQWLMCTIATSLAFVCFAMSLTLPKIDLDACQAEVFKAGQTNESQVQEKATI